MSNAQLFRNLLHESLGHREPTLIAPSPAEATVSPAEIHKRQHALMDEYVEIINDTLADLSSDPAFSALYGLPERTNEVSSEGFNRLLCREGRDGILSIRVYVSSPDPLSWTRLNLTATAAILGMEVMATASQGHQVIVNAISPMASQGQEGILMQSPQEAAVRVVKECVNCVAFALNHPDLPDGQIHDALRRAADEFELASSTSSPRR